MKNQAEVKILVEGYAIQKTGRASSTATFVQENGINVIVDPGQDRDKLLKALAKNKLAPKDIDYVILTHYHLDHALLTGLFEKAKVLDNSEVYFWNGNIQNHEKKVPGTNIQIINTPGHDPFHCSIVADTKNGKAAIAGDIFWWYDIEKQKTDYENLISHQDPYVKDKKLLIESRKKILKLADYIIPGHGKIFKVKKYENHQRTN